MTSDNVNTALVVFGLLVTSTKWLWAKLHHEKTESITDALSSTLDGVATKLAESDDTIDSIRTKLTAAAYEALTRFGVKRSSAMDMIVAMLVDKAVTTVRQRILSRKALESAVIAAATQAEATTGKFTPVGSIPKIGAGLPGEVQVTMVAP